ncbi:replication initiation protein [Holzapfeliella sp. He02]|uniref:Replication initiation protein n=1 Tax=Holzapfeliella saturejae TaxID=3082953 RepID=A0ABU8SJC0_9LACO
MAVNEITKYDKELNSIPLGHLNSVEMNLFFSIITKMRDKGTEVVRFDFNQLQELSDFHGNSRKRFIENILKLYKKMLALNFGITSENGLVHEQFIMFSEFKINAEEPIPYVDIEIYKKAVPLLNELSTWVRFSLKEFNQLTSVYAKTLFRLFKQFRTTGKVILTVEKFNELLSVPKSYKQNNINSKILNPAMAQLEKYFDNLTVKKEYSKTRGRPLKSYTFTFKPEAKNSDDFKKKEGFEKSHKEVSTDWSTHTLKNKSKESDEDVSKMLEELG